MKNILKITLAFAVFMVLTTSCIKDLDTIPIDPDEVSAAQVFDDPASYKAILAKLYAGLAVSGQQGPSGNADISGIDEGFGQYLRGLWYHQELTTDEALISWNDQTIKNFHGQSWGASDVFIAAFYYRIFYQIAACNEYIRETSDNNLNDRGVSGQLRDDILFYRAEARFLRALSYWHAMDLFANVPFVTENDAVGAFFPQQIMRADLFNYVEEQLLDIENLLMDPKSNEYARADKAAAWMLLAKIYLNAEVYKGTSMYDKALTYSEKVINAGYTLDTKYQNVFLADNDGSPEVIFPIAFDGLSTQTWGGTTFIIHAAVGGDFMVPADYGIDGGWGGTRTTSALVDKFEDETGETDSRAMFFTEGQTKEIMDVGNFQDGYAITKFRNMTQEGEVGKHLTYPDTDFPMFRLADAYLMYAEAVLRGGGGSNGAAVGYINDLRQRAYGDNSGNINVNELTLDFILDERARELYWEAHRRTDLVRFGQFTNGTYLWPWKGNAALGTTTDSKFDIFPLPDADVNANQNLVQNPGY